MKRKLIAALLIGSMCMITACADEGQKNSETGQNSSSTETYQNESSKDEVLEGVYQDGTRCVAVPMGVAINGEIKEVCTVKIPENYDVYGFYDTQEGYYGEMTDAYARDVSDAYADAAWSGEEMMEKCFLSSQNGDPLTEITMQVANASFDDVDPAGECREAAGCSYKTYYCAPDPAELDVDEVVYVCLSDDVIAYVEYSGPLAEIYGLETLAENIQALFTVSR